ncbi:initiation factor 2B subunit alpha [Carbonactinospora thermoautotrophica]|uniref:Methylthioribose-1-phosphate isomerase n=2 Tax=Carbonactinospora thermoautotrophica TaxID=1469144 RepID=A0A132MJT7_9ACTN|nr:S-methyl-5-thioribose-1-phosphate isomerase [Carbonactinospora thermoautotrophica]KWW98137.1 initiation factor 2B subunit alpha [Carbonactinospora thermoautotrophica]KWX02847.1 Methylthioribose-1-phosphate isomerase [Carbonactinospora thermoautotrophica]
MRRTIDWDGGPGDPAIATVDQCALPHEHRVLRLRTVDELIDAIKRLAIRGAPALGAAGALGVALSAYRHPADEAAVRDEAARLAAARPTAVNLGWGVERALKRLPEGPDAVLAEALAVLEEDERANRKASRRAADLILQLCPRRPLRLLTHCNTGRLATVAWGTALGVVWHLAADGQLEYVLADETRPLLQGARLTAWELAEAGIPYRVLVDSAAPAALAQGLVDAVVVGADRIAANGDVANKIGTYAVALAAARHRVPFVVVAPESTLDLSIPDGSRITIEERPVEEVTRFAGQPVTPPGAGAFNPAFDVTPADLVTAIVTEDRVFHGPGAGQ